MGCVPPEERIAVGNAHEGVYERDQLTVVGMLDEAGGREGVAGAGQEGSPARPVS